MKINAKFSITIEKNFNPDQNANGLTRIVLSGARLSKDLVQTIFRPISENQERTVVRIFEQLGIKSKNFPQDPNKLISAVLRC